VNWLRGLWHKTFSHGVHPPQWKDATRSRPIRRLPFAPRLILPLAQHIGAPSVPIVTRRQEVGRGEPIARARGFVSLPLHAPATGVIEGIELMPNARGEKREAIVLRPYPGSTQELQYTTPRDVEALSPQEIVTAVQDTGMAGLGGAAFPTHVKLGTRPDRPIGTLLVNGCECEPHLTTDHRVMLERGEDLVAGIRIAMRALGAQQCVIGIEDNKPDAIAAMRARVGDSATIRVRPVRTKYPQGAEKLLIKAALGREVPAGGLPADIGVAVQNVGTLAEIGYLLPRGIGLIERVVTITGPGVRQPGNYIVPLGTPVGFVLENIGRHGRVEEVILGGPMMGAAVGSLEVPVTKGVSGILVLDEPAVARETRKVHPCIKCGKCVEACPMHLNPSQLGMLAAKREYAVMEERYHLNECFECGCCTYVCPSGIPLVQHFRIAKAMNREAREREAAAVREKEAA
jgi:electron transport complex protein RnfC